MLQRAEQEVSLVISKEKRILQSREWREREEERRKKDADSDGNGNDNGDSADNANGYTCEGSDDQNKGGGQLSTTHNNSNEHIKNKNQDNIKNNNNASRDRCNSNKRGSNRTMDSAEKIAAYNRSVRQAIRKRAFKNSRRDWVSREKKKGKGWERKRKEEEGGEEDEEEEEGKSQRSDRGSRRGSVDLMMNMMNATRRKRNSAVRIEKTK